MSEKKKDGKVFWKSKRFYTTLLTAVLPLIPPVADFAKNYPEVYGAIMATVFGWVGLVTKEPVRLEMK